MSATLRIFESGDDIGPRHFAAIDAIPDIGCNILAVERNSGHLQSFDGVRVMVVEEPWGTL